MLLADLVATSHAVATTPARSAKTSILADLLLQLSADEAAVAVSFLAGRPRQERLGIGYATTNQVEVAPAERASLTVLDVDRTLSEIAGTAGAGSQGRRRLLLSELLGSATEPEQAFLRGLILRNVRQGALDGVMVEAVAVALDVPAASVRRAVMLEGDLVGVAARALVEGPASLAAAGLEVFTPVQPMLAKTADTTGTAVAALGTAVIEWKLDGARVQVHRKGSRVEVFTRNLRNVTASLPELVELAGGFSADSFILDGEALLMGPGGVPSQFQDSMSRFGSASGLEPMRAYFFDLLYLDGEDLIDRPLGDRREILASVFPSSVLIGSIVTDDQDEADLFFEKAVEAGYEGVVVKDLSLPYEAGRRGSGWLKVKPTHTLDLVVLAAEWGSGRRRGWLSNLHLGARDPAGGYVMLGKTFKGLTDAMLEWQTAHFLELEDHRDGHVVFLRPQVVYEIAFDGVQRSRRYPGGVALRFARVKRHRPDKTPADADTIETVRRFVR